MNLEPALATGLILVSCCPGGQASNVATYIANGNVALSVLMTTASTVGAIVMTPFLTKARSTRYLYLSYVIYRLLIHLLCIFASGPQYFLFVACAGGNCAKERAERYFKC